MKKITRKKDKRTDLEKEIDSVIDSLKGLEEDSKEYADRLKVLDQLVTLRDKIKKSNKDKVSKDTWVQVGGTLLSIGAVLYHEKAHIITGKAWGLVPKILIKGRV